jgi:hypothetical protein
MTAGGTTFWFIIRPLVGCMIISVFAPEGIAYCLTLGIMGDPKSESSTCNSYFLGSLIDLIVSKLDTDSKPGDMGV